MTREQKIVCPLSDEALIVKAKELIKQLCETGGKSWTLRVPVDLGKDPDIIFSELCNRLEAEREKVKRLVEGLGKIDVVSFSQREWIKMSEIQEIAKQLLREYGEQP